ncbi:23S rRNA pseudouridylate synthase [Bifidobacterium sp. DSM 109958]|uniref:RNA pseudouridylate synthase n=1 Tax=Bifidobacterium moraviense TaxID=2675323 RepID=A0A7Y0F3A7_9BIFI|nr:23S rRNA pseudouridylate synthase [Bifidobacterium sp. DSM 109958]
MLEEPEIPFGMGVLYEDERIVVVDKPHFLATTPRGMWYRQTALMRLRERYDDPLITPAHRLDRLTAGVVVFVRDPACRGAYQMLFQEHRAVKTYECLAPCAPVSRPRFGTVEPLEPPRVFPLRRRSRIVKRRGVLQAYEEPGAVNAETVIEIGGGVPGRPDLRSYVLHPRTGKTHQLRVHMASLGLPITGDDFYPVLRDPRSYDDFDQPLELVARTLEFTDPVTGEPRRFESRIPLGAGIAAPARSVPRTSA